MYFSFPQMYQRIYTVLKELDPENLIIHHTSARLNAPALAYADIYLSGERNWRPQDGIPLGDSYLDRIGLDEWCAEFMGHPHGVIGWFLPQFGVAVLTPAQQTVADYPGWPPNDVAPIKEVCDRLMGVGLRHDLYFNPRTTINPDATVPIFEVQEKFGHVDAEFFPYWKNGHLIGGQSEVIKASACRKPAGGALVVVSNTTQRAEAHASANLGPSQVACGSVRRGRVHGGGRRSRRTIGNGEIVATQLSSPVGALNRLRALPGEFLFFGQLNNLSIFRKAVA